MDDGSPNNITSRLKGLKHDQKLIEVEIGTLEEEFSGHVKISLLEALHQNRDAVWSVNEDGNEISAFTKDYAKIVQLLEDFEIEEIEFEKGQVTFLSSNFTFSFQDSNTLIDWVNKYCLKIDVKELDDVYNDTLSDLNDLEKQLLLFKEKVNAGLLVS